MPILTTLGAACARAWGFTSGLLKDPYFNLTTLLLPGNGTNGAQNNTFLDSSTNNFTITRNGNTTQGTFSPFSQTGWGNYFSGSGALSIPSSTPNQFGSGDFTIETWYYCSGSIATASQHIFFRRTTVAPIGLIVEIDGSKLNLRAGDSNVSGWEVNIASTTTLVANTWYHLAVSRSGSSWRLFVNGTLEASATASFTIAEETGNIAVATNIPGYLSNWRVLKGVALYTSNFTVPTTPLTAISGTAILTCQSNRFLDNSSNAFTISTSGSPSVVAFSPFAPTAAYTTAAVGGSGYFDGTGDYLTGPANAAFAQGTGDFTVEAWVFPTGNGSSSPSIFDCRVSGNEAGGFILGLNTSYTPIFYTNALLLTGSKSCVLNAWNHLALTRSSNTVTLWLNGESIGTVANSTNFTTQGCYVGMAYTGVNNPFMGYMATLRVVKGTAVYTTAFTPPTAPLTAITNTSLLLNFTNAGITDATAKNDLETVGNAQISTSVSKFGGGSIAFDGTGDYLKGVYSPLMILSGDFTIECWLYYTAHGSYGGIVSFANSNTAAAPTSGWAFVFYAATNNLYFETGTGFNLQTTNTVPSGTWNHVAVVRSGSTITHYLNGTANGSGSSSATFTPLSTDNFVVGVDRGLASTITGYIDDMRISRYARYTGNFTPPTAPFPVQ